MASPSPSDQKATVLDGKAIAQSVRLEIAEEVRLLSQRYGKVPGLAVVRVGDRKDDQSYADMKRKACAEVGIKCFDIHLPHHVSQADVICRVRQLNQLPDVHGILVQLPFPKHINEEKILSEISLEKDVDGFHPFNFGKLAMTGKDPLFLPCAPKGCLELLKRSGVTIMGKKAVVVGQSNIVGLPISLLLLKLGATVTIVHSHTPDPESITREADIVIAAAGQSLMIKGSWIKPGAAVLDVGFIVFAATGQSMMVKGSWIKSAGAAILDVGTNVVDESNGYGLVGDVDFHEACNVAGYITPVPGGVGPVTVAMLLRNTLDGAKRVIEQ